MRIDWWTLALQTINLLVLVWILGRFLFRPISQIIADRQAAADSVLEEAKASREQARAAQEEAEKAVSEAAAKRSELIAAATSEAEKDKAALLAAARKEADALREAARQEIVRLRETEAAQNSERASRLAVDIAGRLFDRLPPDARIAGFIEGLADGLADLPPEARAEFGTDGETVTLKAARALSPEEEQAIHAALAKAIGHAVAPKVTVEPPLLAGLELETPHASVRNSFRNDLARIADELTREESDHG